MVSTRSSNQGLTEEEETLTLRTKSQNATPTPPRKRKTPMLELRSPASKRLRSGKLLESPRVEERVTSTEPVDGPGQDRVEGAVAIGASAEQSLINHPTPELKSTASITSESIEAGTGESGQPLLLLGGTPKESSHVALDEFESNGFVAPSEITDPISHKSEPLLPGLPLEPLSNTSRRAQNTHVKFDENDLIGTEVSIPEEVSHHATQNYLSSTSDVEDDEAPEELQLNDPTLRSTISLLPSRKVKGRAKGKTQARTELSGAANGVQLDSGVTGSTALTSILDKVTEVPESSIRGPVLDGNSNSNLQTPARPVSRIKKPKDIHLDGITYRTILAPRLITSKAKGVVAGLSARSNGSLQKYKSNLMKRRRIPHTWRGRSKFLRADDASSNVRLHSEKFT